MAQTISCPRCRLDVEPEGDGPQARFPLHAWPAWKFTGAISPRCGASGQRVTDVGENGRLRGDVSAHQGLGPERT